MAEPVFLTKEGKEELERELRVLIDEKRPEIADRIKVAREHGDLSENAEYESARNEQAHNEGRIAEIENILKYAQIIDGKGKKDVISLGATIDVYDKTYDEEMTFKILGTTEADVTQGKISNESPIGNALLGRRVGETVEIETPEGIIVLEIKKVY